MSALHLRRVFLATTVLSSLAFSGCSSLGRETTSIPTASPATAPVALPPLAQPVVAAPLEATSTVVETAVAEALAAHAAAKPTRAAAPQYRDIFARIRAGFKLEDPEQRAVDVQLSWYVNNPEYLERTFGRGELYLHHIVQEVEARNLPMELALLPVVESAYEPFGYSHARAAGLWQFIPGTGTRFGLKQNWWYDGRRDVVESTRAALDYLTFLHDEFDGDWLLAVAAYNCGEVNVRRAIQRNRAAGKPTDFWHLKLPKETRAYVPKLLAMRRVVAYPGDYGLEFSPIANTPYFAMVDTGGQIDLSLATELAGITHEELWNLNPAFNRWATDPEGPHRLLLPVDVSTGFTESLALVPVDQRVRTESVTVDKGENITQLAKRTGTSSSVIKQINGLKSTQIRAGQELLVPAPHVLPAKVAMAAARVDRGGGPSTRGRFHVVRRGESLWSIAQRNGVSVRTLAAMNGMQPGDTLRAGSKIKVRPGGRSSSGGGTVETGEGGRTTYTVKRGDTLSQIARRFSVSVSQLLSWNSLSSGHTIMPGQRLVMYRGG